MTSQFFEAIFFDMDGLTINSEPQWLDAERELTAPYGYQWTVEDQAHCLGGPLTKVGRYISEVTGAESGEYFHRAIIELMTKKVRSGVNFMPGARELIDSLKVNQVPIALVSASPRAIVEAALGHFASGIFPISISADDVKKTKPDPEGYLKAAELLGVDIHNSLILEDSITGVSAALASGARVIAVPHIVKIDENPKVRIFKSLENISLDTLRELWVNW